MKDKMMLVVGIALALASAVLMVIDALPLSARIAILIVGIGLIAASNFRK